MKNRKRYVRIVRIYAIAAALTLVLYAYTESVYLTRWRQTVNTLLARAVSAAGQSIRLNAS